MATIERKTFTFYPTHAKANELAAKLLADDSETDYRVVEGSKGFFVAIFEGETQIYTI